MLKREFIFTSCSQPPLLCSCGTAVEFHPTSSNFSVIGILVYIWNDVHMTSGPHRINQNIEVIIWMSSFWCNSFAENYLMAIFFCCLVIYLIKAQWNREQSLYLTFKEGGGRESNLNMQTGRWPQNSKVYWLSCGPKSLATRCFLRLRNWASTRDGKQPMWLNRWAGWYALQGAVGHCFSPGVVLGKQCIGLLSYFLTACCCSYHTFPFGEKHSINSGLAWAPFPFWFLLTCGSNRNEWKQLYFLCSHPVSSCCALGSCTCETIPVPTLVSQTLGPCILDRHHLFFIACQDYQGLWI